jgi:hypothetical protein
MTGGAAPAAPPSFTDVTEEPRRPVFLTRFEVRIRVLTMAFRARTRFDTVVVTMFVLEK